jgi:hypothetical protein
MHLEQWSGIERTKKETAGGLRRNLKDAESEERKIATTSR